MKTTLGQEIRHGARQALCDALGISFDPAEADLYAKAVLAHRWLKLSKPVRRRALIHIAEVRCLAHYVTGNE